MTSDVTVTASTVVAIQGTAISTTSPTDGQVLTYVNADGKWEPVTPPSSLPPSGSAGGDLGSTYPNPSVINIHGASVPAAGSLTTGNVLQVTGSSALSYAAINLAGGSNYVTGTLPTGNQASQSMGGDVSGTTASSTVTKLQGRSVVSTAPTDGYVLTWVNANSDWEPKPISSSGGLTLQTFTSSGTWVAPAGVTTAIISCFGGGGGGGNAGVESGGAGGGGGSLSQTATIAVTPNTSYTVTIGAGGTGGNDGGDTQFKNGSTVLFAALGASKGNGGNTPSKSSGGSCVRGIVVPTTTTPAASGFFACGGYGGGDAGSPLAGTAGNLNPFALGSFSAGSGGSTSGGYGGGGGGGVGPNGNGANGGNGSSTGGGGTALGSSASANSGAGGGGGGSSEGSGTGGTGGSGQLTISYWL